MYRSGGEFKPAQRRSADGYWQLPPSDNFAAVCHQMARLEKRRRK